MSSILDINMDDHLYLLVIHALGQYQIWAIFNELKRAKDAFEILGKTAPPGDGISKAGIYLYKMKVNGPTPNFDRDSPIMSVKGKTSTLGSKAAKRRRLTDA